MNLLKTTKAELFLLLAFSFAIVFAQTSKFEHDFEHQFHDKQQSCELYLAFENSADTGLYSLTIKKLEEVNFVSSSYTSYTSEGDKAAFSVRAPPQYQKS